MILFGFFSAFGGGLVWLFFFFYFFVCAFSLKMHRVLCQFYVPGATEASPGFVWYFCVFLGKLDGAER